MAFGVAQGSANMAFAIWLGLSKYERERVIWPKIGGKLNSRSKECGGQSSCPSHDHVRWWCTN